MDKVGRGGIGALASQYRGGSPSRHPCYTVLIILRTSNYSGRPLAGNTLIHRVALLRSFQFLLSKKIDRVVAGAKN